MVVVVVAVGGGADVVLVDVVVVLELVVLVVVVGGGAETDPGAVDDSFKQAVISYNLILPSHDDTAMSAPA